MSKSQISKKGAIFLCLLLLSLSSSVFAEPFKRIRLRKLIGDPAELTWSQNNVIRTGKSSKAEFEFQENKIRK
jgi:hypothetical protein